MRKRIAVMASAIIISFATATTVFAGWYQENGHWKYQREGFPPSANSFPRIDGKDYHFDENGYMYTGWAKGPTGYWYYYGSDGVKAQNQWIESTYYVGNDGRMFVDEFTPDGYYVGSDGRYIEGQTTTRELQGPADRNTKQPASAYTGAPLDGGTTEVADADAGKSQVQDSGSPSGSEQVLVEGNVSSVGRISAPLPDEIMGGFCYAVNSADGVKVRWKATNLTGKTVKYYSVGIAVKNPVGDYCIDQITKEDVKWLKYVGPVAPGEDFIVFDIVGYYGAPHEIIIPLIELEYMDGTKEMVEYLYSTTEQHQRIL